LLPQMLPACGMGRASQLENAPRSLILLVGGDGLEPPTLSV
jgi:hypothetical protein